jgi:ADP-ribose pyrophosphatase YjhB (NUDIX family)
MKIKLDKLDRGAFLVNVLGIVYDSRSRKVLIGRVVNDKYMKKLSWCFPGGRPAYKKDLESYLKDEIKKKTGISVKAERIVFAKTYPENRKFLSVYYLCKPLGTNAKPKEKFVEVKWVKPADVAKYFKKSTSIHPFIVKFLRGL